MALVNSSRTPMSVQAPHLHIVAACTDRKRGEIPQELRLGEIPEGEPGERAARWWRRLDAAMPLLRVPASHVYAGEHWKLVQDLTNAVRQAGWRADLWVASAGYGLLSERTLITPYSCTFAEGSPDQVSRGQPSDQRVAYNQAWWSALATLRHNPEVPTSLSALAERSPKANFLVLCSPEYVKAMHADLVVAAQQLRRPDQLTIITSDAGWDDDPLSNNVLVIDSRVRSKWGGTMQGLHARTALELLKELAGPRKPVSTADLREKYERLVADTPKPEKLNRARMTDEEVIDFLRAELAKTPNSGHTRLLRTLRDSGRACEQGRFRQLFKQVAEESRAGTTQ